MLSGATFRAAAIAGAAVFKIVVSSDSMKKATATSQGRSRLLDVSIVVAGSGFLIGDTTVCRKYTESVDEAYVRNRLSSVPHRELLAQRPTPVGLIGIGAKPLAVVITTFDDLAEDRSLCTTSREE